MKKILLATAIALLFTANAEAGRRHYKKKAEPVPTFSAKSYLVADEHGDVIKELDMDEVRPIASITKLMLSYVVADQNMDEELAVPNVRTVQSQIPRTVYKLPRRELLTLALVKSDNFAAQILCSNLEGCIDKMNETSVALGMTHTKFVEPTGLSAENVSSASDLLKLVMASSEKPVIAQISSMPAAEIQTDKRVLKVKNTNPLTSKLTILLSKTGYTKPAGGCLVMILDTQIGRKIFILLGSKNAHSRIPDMEKLVREI